MNVNVNQIVNQLNTWDLAIDGNPTRCPTLAEAAKLDELARRPAPSDLHGLSQHFESIRLAMAPLFVGEDRPNLSTWGEEALGVALAVLIAYQAERTKKKGEEFKAKMRTLFPTLTGSP